MICYRGGIVRVDVSAIREPKDEVDFSDGTPCRKEVEE